ncbi:unknown protein [Seminavis robusta]|uniref:DUF4116 domain-containing protein n=1 Tax=Seminavis robusta TaxID=568900 RepID=A0A9N8E8L9_9STRA|nr:unknown protein [Seminavis robusta]|eukprot:Sro742_g195940.1 n/a (237) ;mRNA; r:29508-30338
MLAVVEKSVNCQEVYRISDRLRDDETFIRNAIYIAGNKALDLASERLGLCALGNKAQVLRALDESTASDVTGLILKQMPEDLKSDRDVFLAAAETGVGVLQHASEGLRDDESLVLKTILYDALNAFKNTPPRLRTDKSFVIKAMQISPKHMYLIHSDLLTDTEFLNELAEQVRFHSQLKRLGRDMVIGPRPPPGPSRDEWLEALDRANTLYNDALSVSALFYFLSHCPAIIYSYEA